MRVFLTGATGYLGGALVERLAAEAIDVLALARPAREGKTTPHPRVEWLYADLRDSIRIAEAARSADAAIHAAAEHFGNMQEVDELAIGALVAGLKGSGKPLISTSATVVYGDTGLVRRTEAEPILNPVPSRAWRVPQDRRVAKLADQGIRGVVVRPCTIYGRGTGVIGRRIDAAKRSGVAVYVGDGAARWSSVHVDDLTDLYLLALRNVAASGIYNAASDQDISRRALAETIAATFGPGIEARSVSVEEARRDQGDLAAMGTINQLISYERAQRELGWTPRRAGLVEELTRGSYRKARG